MSLLSKIITSNSSAKSKSSGSGRFLPNIKQLNEAIEKLPDANSWTEKTYTHKVQVDGKERTLQFNLIYVRKGGKRINRWVYEGKILIRNRDR